MMTNRQVAGPVALLAGLVDDAGLFPPEELPMRAALERHRVQHANPIVTGRFLCPASRLDECLRELDQDEHLSLGLICGLSPADVQAALRAVVGDPRVQLGSVEGVLPVDRSGLATGAVPRPLYVEIRPDDPDLETTMEWLAREEVRAKVRCGGLRADLFPSAEALARFVRACADHGVAFKATAGLHHAVAHRGPDTGFDHHGFLNLVLAATRAAAGASIADIADVLRMRDASPLVAEAAGIASADATRGRALFACYGSCSTTEPLEDLVALGLISPEEGS